MDADVIKAVCDSTGRVVLRVEPDQYELSTPCKEWNVGELLNHLLSTLELGAALLGDRPPSVQVGPGGVPAEDLIDGDLVGAYRAGVDAVIASATSDAVARTHTTPLGEMPGSALARFVALDVFVHGWDVAIATGQDASFDTTLAETILEFARETLSHEMGTRAPRIGPEIPAAPDAAGIDRLVAFLGRAP